MMKVKILAYSESDFNKVVARYEHLEQVNDNVFTYLYEKSAHGEDLDLIGVVFKIEDVYYHERTYSRRALSKHDIGSVGTEYIANFRQNIESAMQNDQFITLLVVRIYEALGWDSKPIIEYREQKRARQDEKRRIEEQEKAEAQRKAIQETAERERLKLKISRDNFRAGRFIATKDFIALCKEEDVSIPLRTHGTLNNNVTEVDASGSIRYIHQRGKRKPNLTGCGKLIRTLAEKLNGAVVESDEI